MPRDRPTQPPSTLLTTAMPRSPTPAARAQRNAAIRADRARGWPLRKIARHYGISLALAHRLAADVHIQLPGAWHVARMPKAVPLPPCPQAVALHWRLYAKAQPHHPQ